MLVHLRVRNFGIIEDFDWTPGPGFNVLTGETGAGKSLVVDAVSALLSGRLDEMSVRHGADETRLEGVFDIADRPDIVERLVDKGVECGDEPIIVSLSLKRGGRAVMRVNGDAVPRGLITQLGRQIIDIHGQSQHLSLLDRASHLDFLDAYAGTMKLRQEFGREAQKLHQLEKQIENLTKSAVERVRQADYLGFQLQEIDRAALRDGEDAELEQELLILSSAEKLKVLAFEAVHSLDSDDTQGDITATSSLSQALSSMEKLTCIDGSLSSQTAALREALCNVTEAVRDLRSYYAGLDFDPARLEEIENRLGLIRDLKRKYGNGIGEILALAEKIRRELADIDSSDERIGAMRQEFEHSRQVLAETASKLSAQRHARAADLAATVNLELVDLAMDKVRFEIKLNIDHQSDGLPQPDGQQAAYNNTGIDRVEFLAATNPGEPAKALERIASTGELSRFTLAVKTALAQADQVPVLIFDEIDIGVGGRSGDVIGRKLASLASSHQVICVTHLPQIACYAKHHFTVNKSTDGGRTAARLDKIEAECRVKELALMLSGDASSTVSEAGARELLERAGRFNATLKGS